MTFRFDHRSHTYFVGARRVPSVTGVIEAAGLHAGSQWYTEESRIRGTRVHRACLDVDLMGDHGEIQYRGYVESYLRWREMMKPTWVTLEQPRYSRDLALAGTADRLGVIAGVPCVVDLKTGGKEKWHPVQLAYYDLLYDELPPRVRRRFGLYLRADGRIAHHHEYREPQDYIVAMNLLREQKEKKANGSKQRTRRHA
jgi:hypothetical protein